MKTFEIEWHDTITEKVYTESKQFMSYYSLIEYVKVIIENYDGVKVLSINELVNSKVPIDITGLNNE
jgi:hypothetical protein